MAESPLVLLGDLGGTNLRLALDAGAGFERVETLAAAACPALESMLADYLHRHADLGRPRIGALAVAAPVDGDRVHLTNLACSFSTADLHAALGLEELLVCNDLVAMALAVPRLGAGDWVAVGPACSPAGTVTGVLGPGTGLGTAALVRAGEGWLALPGEGGHATLAATDEREWAVVRALAARFGHASAERALSGPGLQNLYRALDGAGAEAEPEPEAIVAAARAGDDRAGAALELFFALLGVVAGNLALTLGASGGIYLAGGILPRIVDCLQASAFRARFEAKGRFCDYLAAIPTRLIVHPYPAFLGLALHVQQSAGTRR